ncbi:MAG: putative multi-sensor signal transduction histidine kinase [Myxococcales bacterium]|nr:putative multi-sensor signal transduction histidine kinase [Myxococcales bacterium]
MTAAVERRRGRRHAIQWALGIFVVLAGMTLAVWTLARQLGERAVIAQSRLLAGQVGERIRECVITRIEMISQIRREWSLGGIRDDQTFATRVDALLATFPGYLAINRIDEDGVLTFVAPRHANQAALGRNVSERPVAAAEYQRTLAERRPRLTPPIELFQGGTGIAAYVPTELSDEPPMTLNGVFRTESLIRACLGEDDVGTYALAIRDGERPLFTRDLPDSVTDLGVETTLPVHNRTWTLRVVPVRSAVDATLEPQRLVLINGLILSAFVAALLFVLLTMRAYARDRALLVAQQQKEERERMNAKLQQVQRMEALGQLAAAVAHDFNNLLTVILLSADSIPVHGHPEAQRGVKDIEEAARRGVALAKELVTFGKGDVSAPAKLDLAAVVNDMRGMIVRLTGPMLDLELAVTKEPAPLLASKTQLEQILVNLVVNAVAAMPDGGKLTVTVTLADGKPQLSVADTGVGIPPEVLPQIFEPFFTTKAAGEGTGLGLATVYSHVQRMGGTLDVDSTVGAGTRFTATFPPA